MRRGAVEQRAMPSLSHFSLRPALFRIKGRNSAEQQCAGVSALSCSLALLLFLYELLKRACLNTDLLIVTGLIAY
jgi:multisubunit Na+/H+ antiporter MnhF subunit